LRLFSFGGYGLALATLALVVFGAIECPPYFPLENPEQPSLKINEGSRLGQFHARFRYEQNYHWHGEKDFVGSAKRFVNIASAMHNCCGDNFNCYNMNCCHNYSGHRNK